MNAKPIRLISILSLAVATQVAAQPANQGNAASTQNSAPSQNAVITNNSEVNVAVSQLGAQAQGAGQAGLAAMMAGQGGSAAALAPNTADGSSVTTIQLGSATELSRVALKVGNQKGKLRILVQEPDGTTSAKVVSEIVLDGTQPTVSASVNNITAKAITVVWIPETPGQPLAVADVGVFAVANRLPPAVVAVAAQIPTASNSPLAINVPSAPAANPPASPVAQVVTQATQTPAAPATQTSQTTIQGTQATATALPPQTRPLSVP